MHCTFADLGSNKVSSSSSSFNIEFHVTEDNGSTMLGLQSCISMRLISLNCENKSVCNDCHNASEVNSLNKDGNNPSYGGQSGNAKKDIGAYSTNTRNVFEVLVSFLVNTTST